jgi:dTDP-glucose 4,6-dehydratase
LLARGDEVICLDNLCTGSSANIAQLRDLPGFSFVLGDVCAHPAVEGPIDAIAHLACPASPPQYLALPLETMAIGSHGSEFVLGLAKRWDCRVLLASTSEVYGDPAVHPQPEGYWGNVNPVGVRSVYDEAKRYAEALFSAHRRALGTNTAIARIFNTYGPRLAPEDGRVVSNFIAQALRRAPITIYGDGTQTRSFCYVSDLVRGLLALLDSDVPGPVNLGNPIEVSVAELARRVLDLTGSASRIEFRPLPQDDPTCRRPDIAQAARLLGWRPEVGLERGLERTIAWQRELLSPPGRHGAPRVRTTPGRGRPALRHRRSPVSARKETA